MAGEALVPEGACFSAQSTRFLPASKIHVSAVEALDRLDITSMSRRPSPTLAELRIASAGLRFSLNDARSSCTGRPTPCHLCQTFERSSGRREGRDSGKSRVPQG